MAVLNHPKAWTPHAFTQQVASRHDDQVASRHDVSVVLQSPEYMNEQFGDDDALRGLSVSVMSPDGTTVIHIHESNWRCPPAVFTGTRDEYRTYLILHEMGHHLGLPHPTSKRAPDGRCYVMYQQTRGTRTCRPNPYPLQSERDRAVQAYAERRSRGIAFRRQENRKRLGK